jgi:UDP-glucose 4-epimerase
MHALITGGAGFIGRHLTERLLDAGHQVTAIDNFSTGRRANTATFQGNDNYRLVVGNVCDSELLPSLVLDADFVFHLAASLGVRLIVERPTRCMENNLHGTERILRLASDLGKPVLIASTSEVYGKSSKPCQEDQDLVFGNTGSLRWSYACCKALNEFLGISYSRHHGLPLIVVRLFNTIGPFQSAHYGMVVPRFVRAALANKPLEIYGDGQQSRCFCDVSDVTDALIALAQSDRARGEVFNVGSDHEISVNELADLVIELTGSQSERRFVPFETVYGRNFEETRRRVPDLTKIREAIGYRPRVLLEDSIMRIVRQMELDPSERFHESSRGPETTECSFADRVTMAGVGAS